MKRFSVLAIVLVMVLAVGSVGFAGALNGTKEADLDRLNATINVSATVGPYAAFLKSPVIDGYGKSYNRLSDERVAELNLNFVGREDEKKYPIMLFDIASNTPIGLEAEFKELSSMFDGEEYRIATKLRIDPIPNRESVKYGKKILDKWATSDGSLTAASIEKLQAVERITYRLWVTGQLGEIEDQAAGDYKTEVLLTIVAANL